MEDRETIKKYLASVGIVVLLIFSVASYINHLKTPVSPKGEVKAFVVYEGESVSSIAKRLQSDNLIKSSWIFKYSLKRKGLAGHIAAGDFQLSSAMSMDEIIKNLVAEPVDKWVRLIEGWRVEEYARELNDKLQIPNDKFIHVAKKHEGYLFPDTYLFNPDAQVGDIISILMANFDKKYDVTLQDKIKKLGLTPQQGVILASIVEREARSKKARTMVATILLKRLKINMGLQADATVQYALGYQKEGNPPAGGWWKRHLTTDDLKVDSPYNTYLYVGLPPTPICNPSLISLQAVAEADSDTAYLYYYHDSKGNSHYAKTLEKHNENVANNH